MATATIDDRMVDEFLASAKPAQEGGTEQGITDSLVDDFLASPKQVPLVVGPTTSVAPVPPPVRIPPARTQSTGNPITPAVVPPPAVEPNAIPAPGVGGGNLPPGYASPKTTLKGLGRLGAGVINSTVIDTVNMLVPRTPHFDPQGNPINTDAAGKPVVSDLPRIPLPETGHPVFNKIMDVGGQVIGGLGEMIFTGGAVGLATKGPRLAKILGPLGLKLFQSATTFGAVGGFDAKRAGMTWGDATIEGIKSAAIAGLFNFAPIVKYLGTGGKSLNVKAYQDILGTFLASGGFEWLKNADITQEGVVATLTNTLFKAAEHVKVPKAQRDLVVGDSVQHLAEFRKTMTPQESSAQTERVIAEAQRLGGANKAESVDATNAWRITDQSEAGRAAEQRYAERLDKIRRDEAKAREKASYELVGPGAGLLPKLPVEAAPGGEAPAEGSAVSLGNRIRLGEVRIGGGYGAPPLPPSQPVPTKPKVVGKVEPRILSPEEQVNETQRIKEPAGQPIMPYETARQEAIKAGVPLEEYGIMNKADWDARLEKDIARYVEEPVQPLVRQVLEEGNRPYTSNAYGPGEKGVRFKRPDGTEGFYPLKGEPESLISQPAASSEAPSAAATVKRDLTVPVAVEKTPPLAKSSPPVAARETPPSETQGPLRGVDETQRPAAAPEAAKSPDIVKPIDTPIGNMTREEWITMRMEGVDTEGTTPWGGDTRSRTINILRNNFGEEYDLKKARTTAPEAAKPPEAAAEKKPILERTDLDLGKNQTWQVTSQQYVDAVQKAYWSDDLITRNRIRLEAVEEHYATIHDAIEAGLPVPKNILLEFHGADWADAALAKMGAGETAKAEQGTVTPPTGAEAILEKVKGKKAKKPTEAAPESETRVPAESVDLTTGSPMPRSAEEILLRNRAGTPAVAERNTPSEPVEEKTGDPSLKERIMTPLREKRGLPPADILPAETQQQWLNEAKQRMSTDVSWIPTLLTEIEKTPRALTPVEWSGLNVHYTALSNAYETQSNILRDLKKTGNQDQKSAAQELLDNIFDQTEKMENVATLSKSISGKSLAALKMALWDDYSLVRTMRKAKHANGNEPVPEPLENQLKEFVEKIKELDEAGSVAEAEAAGAALKDMLDTIGKKNPAERVADVSTDEWDAALKGLEKEAKVASLFKKIRKSDTLESLIDKVAMKGITKNLAQRLFKLFIGMGQKRNVALGSVHTVFKEFDPDIGFMKTFELISGYGDYRPASTNPLDIATSQARSELQQIGKLKDMIEGKAPRKSGIGYQEPSAEGRDLIKMVNEVKKRRGIEVTDPATQLKSAMAAIQTRLNHEIDDMARQIVTREKTLRGKTDLVYDAATQALRDKRNEIKSIYDEVFPPEKTPPTQEQLLARAKRMKDLELARLEKQIEGDYQAIFGKKEKGLKTTDPEYEAKKKEVLARREALAELKTDLTPERPADQVELGRLETRLAGLKAKLTQGLPDLFRGRAKIETPETVAAKKEITAIEKQINDMRKTLAPPRTRAEVLANEVSKARPGTPERDKAIAKLTQTIIADGRISDINALVAEVQKYVPDVTAQDIGGAIENTRNRTRDQRSEKLERDEDLLDREMNKKEARDGINQIIYDLERARRTGFQKFTGFLVDVLRGMRGPQTSGDLPPAMRQGVMQLYPHPVRVVRALPEAIAAIFSRKSAAKSEVRAALRYKRSDARKAKLSITTIEAREAYKKEEDFPGVWTGRTKGKLKYITWPWEVVSASQRGFTTFRNRVALDALDDLYAAVTGPKGWHFWRFSDSAPPTKSEWIAIGREVNESTGRGSMSPGMQRNMSWLNFGFYSPRLLISRFQMLMGHSFWGGSKRTRMVFAEETVRRLMGIAGMYTLANLAGCSINLMHPTRGDFGKIKLPGKDKDGNDMYLDPMGGLAQAIIFLSRIGGGSTETASGESKKTRRPLHWLNQSESVEKKEAISWGQNNSWDIAGRYVRTKLAPLPGTIVNLLVGEDVIGNPVTGQSMGQNLITPMAWNDIYNIMRVRGVPDGTALALLVLLGTNMVQYKSESGVMPEYQFPVER